MTRIARLMRAPPTARASRQLVRYAIVAGCGYVIAVAAYGGELAIGIAPYLALGVAFVLNGLFNFALLRLWAFPPSGRSVRSDLGRFCGVAAASFVVNYASFAILYSGIGIGAATAQRLAIIIAAPITFFANRVWAFQGFRPAPSPQADSES